MFGKSSSTKEQEQKQQDKRDFGKYPGWDSNHAFCEEIRALGRLIQKLEDAKPRADFDDDTTRAATEKYQNESIHQIVQQLQKLITKNVTTENDIRTYLAAAGEYAERPIYKISSIYDNAVKELALTLNSPIQGNAARAKNVIQQQLDSAKITKNHEQIIGLGELIRGAADSALHSGTSPELVELLSNQIKKLLSLDPDAKEKINGNKEAFMKITNQYYQLAITGFSNSERRLPQAYQQAQEKLFNDEYTYTPPSRPHQG